MFGLKPRETRGIDANSWGGAWEYITAGPTWSGANVNTNTSMQLLAVYGCVKFICDGISTLPVDEIRVTPDGGRIEVSPKTAWLEQPTPDLWRVPWTKQVLTSVLLDGNAYLWVQRVSDRDAVVTPLDPKKVTVYRDQGRKRYLINGAPTNAEIWHLPGLMMPGADVGLSPVEMARQTIGLGLGAEEIGARQFGQGMTMPGVIEVPNDMPAEGAGSAKELAKQFARMHGGKNKAGLPAVLVGDAKWKSTGVTNEQAQFLQTRQFTAAQIASFMFNIDPTEFGVSTDKGSSITYANLEQRNSRKVSVTFQPWIVLLEQALSAIVGTGTQVKYNVGALLRGDVKTRYESYKIGLDEDFLQLEEVRALEDLPPLPESAPSPPSLVEQIEAVGQLIRAGFDPDASLQAVGLQPIKHTGLHPVTVTSEDATPGVA